MPTVSQQIADWFVTLLRGPLAGLRGADPVLGLALVVLAALVLASALHKRLRLPRLLGYLLVGAVASPAVLRPAGAHRHRPLEAADRPGGGGAGVRAGHAAAAALADRQPVAGGQQRARGGDGGRWSVGLTLMALGAPAASAAAAAALAAATSPVITMAALLEARPRGQVAERLLMLSAINSVLAILAVKLWPVLAHSQGLSAPDSLTLLANASVVIFGSLLLGLACGMLLDRLGRLHDEAATMPVLQLALVILAALLAIAWGLSPFVTLLVAGMTARSRMRHRLTVEPYLGSAGAALTVMLFVSFGVLSTLQDWRSLWPWVLAIILARLVGKGIAIFATARPERPVVAPGHRADAGAAADEQPVGAAGGRLVRLAHAAAGRRCRRDPGAADRHHADAVERPAVDAVAAEAHRRRSRRRRCPTQRGRTPWHLKPSRHRSR